MRHRSRAHSERLDRKADKVLDGTAGRERDMCGMGVNIEMINWKVKHREEAELATASTSYCLTAERFCCKKDQSIWLDVELRPK